MSVLIKGMEMPTCCADCDFHNPFSETPYCRRLLQVISLEGRLENCPLVEVPTPHGRMIDVDLLIVNSHIHWSQTTNESCFPVNDIDDAPTVIEAEE